MLSKNVSHLGFQEAEAFALYHKALDLQKHDRFEESAKAYHELLEARLLREVRPGGQAGPVPRALPPAERPSRWGAPRPGESGEARGTVLGTE